MLQRNRGKFPVIPVQANLGTKAPSAVWRTILHSCIRRFYANPLVTLTLIMTFVLITTQCCGHGHVMCIFLRRLVFSVCVLYKHKRKKTSVDDNHDIEWCFHRINDHFHVLLCHHPENPLHRASVQLKSTVNFSEYLRTHYLIASQTRVIKWLLVI